MRRGIGETHIEDDELRAARFPFHHPLRVRIEIVAGLEVGADEQNDVGVRMIGTWTIEAHPELISAARAGRADVRVRVVAVDAPRR